MKSKRVSLTVPVLLAAAVVAGQTAGRAPSEDERQIPIRVRPTMLAQSIEQLAGQPVEVSGARAVGMFGSRALVIDTARHLHDIADRDRVLVLVEDAEIHVSPQLLVGSTVRVSGVARTLLGIRMTGEVPWPAELDRARLERLEIRAAVLASSIRTAEGVELTARLAQSE